MEIPNCELQHWHYQAVRTNPMYRLEGMMDILREDIMMQLPSPVLELDVEIIPKEVPLQPIEARRLWDAVQQIKAEVQGWREKHAEMLLALDQLQPKKPKSKYD